jgi:hypothetical protein
VGEGVNTTIIDLDLYMVVMVETKCYFARRLHYILSRIQVGGKGGGGLNFIAGGYLCHDNVDVTPVLKMKTAGSTGNNVMNYTVSGARRS